MMPALQIIDLKIDDESKRFAPASKMTSAIYEIIQNKGRCTPKDLFAKGFSPTDLTQHWHIAHSLASLQVKDMPKGDA